MLERATAKALELHLLSQRAVKAILEELYDERPSAAEDISSVLHPNLRGGDYFH